MPDVIAKLAADGGVKLQLTASGKRLWRRTLRSIDAIIRMDVERANLATEAESRLILLLAQYDPLTETDERS